MSEMSLGDMVSILGVLCLASLRVYIGWRCIPESMPKAWRTSVRSRRDLPGEAALLHMPGGRHADSAAASGGAPAYPRREERPAYASFEIQPQ